ncbi:MAG: glycine cleavage system protein GcvH [Candidatus Hydrogenedentes bacterium]|nr:glycine cleavage system protein GcvH [Candidatus Hydrogenedentota bacterium]
MFPKEMKYTKDHEWVREDDGVYTVGITSFAAEQLGDVTYVELPEIGAEVEQGDSAAAVESVKAASDVYAPVGGRVCETNHELEAAPELVNQDPYEQGWFFKLEGVSPAQLKSLLDADAYEKYVGEQAH